MYSGSRLTSQGVEHSGHTWFSDVGSDPARMHITTMFSDKYANNLCFKGGKDWGINEVGGSNGVKVTTGGPK